MCLFIFALLFFFNFLPSLPCPSFSLFSPISSFFSPFSMKPYFVIATILVSDISKSFSIIFQVLTSSVLLVICSAFLCPPWSSLLVQILSSFLSSSSHSKTWWWWKLCGFGIWFIGLVISFLVMLKVYLLCAFNHTCVGSCVGRLILGICHFPIPIDLKVE